MKQSENPISKPSQRYFAIDVLKAFSALTVILIHVTSNYTSEPYVQQIWIWSHFAVGVFVFASGFLLAKYDEKFDSFRKFRPWLKKRAVRLVLPYYTYVLIHVLLIILIPSVFNRITIIWEPKFWIDTVLLNGGFGQNWIPRIFVFLSLLYLCIQGVRMLTRRSDTIYVQTLLISLGISLFFLFTPWKLDPSLSRHYQVFTWLSLMLLGILFYKSSSKNRFAVIGVATSMFITILGYIFLPEFGISASIFKHKYPPTFYFIAYNAGMALLLYSAATRIENFIKSSKLVDTAIQYISNESYTIFFAHVIVMDALDTPTGIWIIDFFVISTITIISVMLWTKGVKRLRSFAHI